MVPFLLASLFASAEPIKLLVLDMEALSGDPSVARSVDPIILGAAGVDGVAVIAQSEIKKMAALDASRAEAGCDTSSCLAELAGALGAQLVLFGSVSQLGETTTLSVSLFDSKTASIDRDTLAVTDVGRLPTDVPPRVRALLARKIAAPAAKPIEPMDLSPLYYAGLGGVVVGGAALLGGGTIAVLNEMAIQDPSQQAQTKRTAQQVGVVGLAVAGAGVVLVGIGAVLLVVAE